MGTKAGSLSTCNLNAGLGWERFAVANCSPLSSALRGKARGWGTQGQPQTLTQTATTAQFPHQSLGLSPASERGFTNLVSTSYWSIKNQQLINNYYYDVCKLFSWNKYLHPVILPMPCGRSGLRWHLILPVKSAAAWNKRERLVKVECFMSQNCRLSFFVSNKKYLL